MSKLTAVEWLEKEMSYVAHFIRYTNVREAFLDAFNQAKQMEKEQTTEAYITGSHHLPIPPKTYGGDHE